MWLLQAKLQDRGCDSCGPGECARLHHSGTREMVEPGFSAVYSDAPVPFGSILSVAYRETLNSIFITLIFDVCVYALLSSLCPK